jgi:Fe-S oxidoreductase
MEDAADLVVRYGGSLSGEHGDGQARAELLPRMFSPPLLQAFREFKTIWDPTNHMNPGKLVEPYGLDEHLRLPDYNPHVVGGIRVAGADQPVWSTASATGSTQPARSDGLPSTHFRFTQDGGSFAQAVVRCVGVGKCRREEAGTMCPSYMATREEQHSTRGRAHLLYEMLQGETIADGWRSEAVKDALDLCLACKGCKGECPVNVDMATYKAEFLSHYYAGRRRPASAYLFGLIMFWARLACRVPWLVNALTHAPVLSDFGKRLVGVAAQREIPRFASETFKSAFRTRRHAVGTKRVILWPDTWTNYFQPHIALAAVEVLEAAGYAVRVPSRDLCCGRPLYDQGMLDIARRLLGQILDALEDEIMAGTPVVVLEPSCASVFREELQDLFPGDERAKRLGQQTLLLSELLVRDKSLSARLDGQNSLSARLPGQAAVVHGHCHHKSTLGFKDEQAVLNALGLDYRVLDSGCCGMAGAFGFEAAHYDVSLQVGERVLLPAVRSASADTLLVADGFSCREQISQTTGRQALHLAEVLARALHAAH